ncbi:MAG: alpha/beta hydrolase fold domain-containing protein [Candidatus Cryosericum sp.]
MITNALVARMFKNPARGGKAVYAERLGASFVGQDSEVDGFHLLSVKGRAENKRHVFFLHGGAYVAEASAGHLRIIKRFVQDFGLHVTSFDYPLAPEYTATTTHRVVLKAYEEVAARYPDHEFCLFGDSAGGGLALALLQVLRNAGAGHRPVRTALVSPWVDLTMSNPDSAALQRKDFILSVSSLSYAARAYAGELALTDPRLSPIYGNLENLGDVLVVTGTNDILYPDCLVLAEKLAQARGTTVRLDEARGLFHDFVVAPLPQTARAITAIGEFFMAG